MQIECPKCSEENNIEFSNNIICGKCQESFAGYSYKKIKKPLISATTALIIGVFGGYKAEQAIFKDQRYPVKIEYQLLDHCINSSRNLRGLSQQAKKTEVCICALNKTMKEFSYKDLKESELKFLAHFNSNTRSCW